MTHFVGCGAQYDPTFWDRDTQVEHVRQMKEAGITFVRLFEFCWSAFEPEADRYDFAWADAFIELLVDNNIAFILCTPEPSPRWLTLTHPETVVMTANGQRDRGEIRRHGCPSSPVFMERLMALTARLAERYGHHENLIGWQIDNELGHPVCHCPLCQDGFRTWLHQEFASLDEANANLGLRMWGREYPTWNDIQIPVNASPQLHHAFRHWTSEHWIKYVRQHVATLRHHSTAPITTNMMAPWHGYDHYAMASQLDVIGMDYYAYGPTGPSRFGYCNTDLDFNLAYTRAIANGNPFWILETDAGGAGRKLPTPGRLAEWTWRHIAHGADLVNYFRWDCPPYGLEGSAFGVVGPGTWPSPAFAAVKDVCHRVNALRPMLTGTRPKKAPVAILFSYAAWWKWLDHPPCQRLVTNPMHAYPFLVRRHCHGLTENHIPFDLIGPDQDWSEYPCMIIPHCPIMDDALIQRCINYVESGGHLLMTAMSGHYDADGVACNAPYPAADLHRLFGVACGPHGAIAHDGEDVTLRVDSQLLHPEGWLDQLTVQAPDCNVLLTYGPGSYEQHAALTARHVTKGTALYLGTVLPQAEMPPLYRFLMPHLNLQSAQPLPNGLWMRSRVASDGREVHFIQNMTDHPADVTLRGLGRISIPAHDTVVADTRP